MAIDMEFEHDTLLTVAELGVTVVGIAGLVAVFLSRGQLQTLDRIRFVFIVVPGIGAAFLAYLAIWIFRQTGDPGLTWLISSAFVLGLMLVAYPIAAANGVLGVTKQLLGVMPRALGWFAIGIPAVNLVLLGTNVIVRSQNLYEIVLFLLVIQSVLQFVSMVMYREGATETS